ncbi:MAG TPA: S8 family serine peptidase, partial [Symbiobacteriaceae bacterium]|nr:S8 family serine peptidase [Symbiobacteriaceae bacterium]
TDSTYSWFDAVNGESLPYDDHGHGTHTTGTMVGREAEGVNEIGVAPGARWIGVKILSGSGSGSTEDILRAGQWLLAPGGDPSKAPDVVNNSWGGGSDADDWFRDVVRAWRAAGIFPAFAAGNSGPGDGSVSNPGNYPESFTVGATDISDNLAGFSGRGPSAYGIGKPEVAAPGVNVRSAVPGGGYEGGWNGTSMATPHVSGTVALLRAANAALTIEEIEQILKQSADAKTDSRYSEVPNNGFGHGILNAYTAVAMVTDGVGTVSGRVLTGGDDFTPPTLQHEPVTEGFKRVPITLTAEVSDDVSVTDVQLRFRMPGMRWWGTVDMERASGDHKSAMYAGTIPTEMTAGDSVEYYVQATDYGGNTATSGTARRPHQVTLLDGVEPGYLQDFEGSAVGWTHDGTADTWAVGEPTSGPRGAHSGTRVAATNLTGDYADSSDSWLMSPPMDLSGGVAGLRFHHWYQLEEDFDYGLVLVSGDGGENWDVATYFTGDSPGWTEQVVDLSPYAGSDAVFVAFYLQSDDSVTMDGWYIDDVELYVDSVPPAAPTGLTATPNPAGSIALAWTPVDAADLDHYTVYRSNTAGSGYQELNEVSGATFMDADTTGGTTYYYVVTATDTFGNESARSAEASATAVSGTVVFQDNMEAGDNGWTHGGDADNWQRGTPTAGPDAANSGSNVWGTNLSGNYNNSENAWLMTPEINLAGLASVNLQFAHWYSLENEFDFGFVEISADGGSTWNEMAVYTSPDGGDAVGWEMPMIDLSAYAGGTVKIRFRLDSDSSVRYPGWYIDDVTVAGIGAAGRAMSRPLSEPAKVTAKVGPKGKPSGPVQQFKIKRAPSALKQSATATGPIGIQSLPVNGTVTVLETGRVVRTDPARGGYSMTLPADTFTLRAEAYGFYPQERQVEVTADNDTTANFILEAIPRGTITGTINDARTGEPIAGASVSLAEDPHVAPALSDANGRFSLQALQGTFTLEVRASGYYPASGPVDVSGGQSVIMDWVLEPFIGMPGEIAYDDGTAENAWGYFAGGNGWAVRMSPPRPGMTTLVQAARIFLWDESWPTPGGNAFQVAVYEATADGKPGRLMGGPVRVTNGVRGDWNDVDLSSLGITITGDFFVAYLQDGEYPDIPGFAFDESTPQTDRNWAFVEGNWNPWDGDGNAMIRARVSYEVGAPAITSPADGSFTNTANVAVTGTGMAGTMITLYADGAQAYQAYADGDGNWN